LIYTFMRGYLILPALTWTAAMTLPTRLSMAASMEFRTEGVGLS
jgi:hypothetical protein